MSKHLGDFDTSTVIYGKFTTFRPSTGAAFTLAGTPAISVYKDNSTTQSTSGVTLTADFDSVTGLNHFAIDTSADGTFYSAGSFFDIVITTGTVDSISVVGSVVAAFTIRKNSSLKPTTAGRALDVSAGGEAGIDWANIGSPTTTVALTGTTVAIVTTTTTATNLTNAASSGDFTATMKTSIGTAVAASAVASVTGNVGGNVTGSVGSVVAQVTANAAQWGGVNVTGMPMPTYAQPTGFLAANFTTGFPVTGTVTLAGTQAFNNTGTWTGDIVGGLFGNVTGDVTGSVNEVVQGVDVAMIGTGAIASTSFTSGAIGTSTFAAGTTIPRVTLADTLTTYTGNTPQTGDSFARIGATGSGLTSLAPSATALSTAVWTPTIAGRIDVALSTLATASSLATAQVAITKIQAAVYDSATLSGSTLTLSNAATMVVGATGRATT